MILAVLTFLAWVGIATYGSVRGVFALRRARERNTVRRRLGKNGQLAVLGNAAVRRAWIRLAIQLGNLAIAGSSLVDVLSPLTGMGLVAISALVVYNTVSDDAAEDKAARLARRPAGVPARREEDLPHGS